jgi:hypothetical protein
MDGDRSSTSGPGCIASAEPTQTSQTMYVEPNAQHRSSAAYCKGGTADHQHAINQHAIISMPSSACDHQHAHHQHAITSMPSSACHHQHAIISMPSSACNHQHAIIRMHACTCSREVGSVGRLQSEVIRGHQKVMHACTCSREVGSVGRLQSEVIRGHQRSSEVIRGHACMHLFQGGWLGGPLAAFPRHVAPPGQRGARVHIRQPTRVHIRQPTRVVLSRRGRVHSGMLFSGADGSEGDENLAEVVLAHLMREAINEDEGGNQRINQCQSIAPRSAHSFAIALNRNPSQPQSIHRTPSHLPRTHALRFEIVQSRALKRDRTSPARTPCGSSRERSRAAST